MAIPQYSCDPTTSFLTELTSQNYSYWFSFDFTVEKTFFQALGHGILCHSQVHYKEIGGYIDRTWTPKVQSLLTAAEQFPPDQRYANPAYWQEIGNKTAQIAIQSFTEAGKIEQANMIKQGKCPGKENSVAYKSLMKHLNLCLTWYEWTSTGIITHVFYNSDTKNDISLFINLAQEGNRLYLLFHRDFQLRSTILTQCFPYYMLVGGEVAPLLIGHNQKKAVAGDNREGMEKLVEELMGLVQIQAKVIRMECRSVQRSTVELIDSMRTKVGGITTLCKVNRLERGVVTEDLTAVLGLKGPEEAVSREHTLRNCGDFAAEDGNFVDPAPHGHRFHVTCLSYYLRSLNLVFPAKPLCPLCDNSALPDTVLKICPEIESQYTQAKQMHMQVTRPDKFSATDTQVGASHGYVPANPSLQHYTQGCVCCNRLLSWEYFLSHGCAVCLNCGVNALETGNGYCPSCGYPLPAGEVEAIKTFQAQAWKQYWATLHYDY